MNKDKNISIEKTLRVVVCISEKELERQVIDTIEFELPEKLEKGTKVQINFDVPIKHTQEDY
jgi:hypothetical protein